MADEAVEQTVSAWVSGLTTQLFNIPLDMTIEHTLFEQYPELRPAQFVSLHDQQLENVVAITDPSIKRLTPHRSLPLQPDDQLRVRLIHGLSLSGANRLRHALPIDQCL